ncbi:MAG: hypothetical protein H7X75_04385, partial [Burkholderiaceae bacterium]|nr:hypothetical protein [Burkholderiaceae bacterium]
ASRSLKVPVTIRRIEASWHGFNPYLVLSDVRVIGTDGNAGLSLPRVEGTVSWISAVALEPRFSSLRVEAPDLEVIRLPNDRFTIAGFLFDPEAMGEDSGLADWVLVQGEIVVRNARIRYSDRRAQTHASFELANANFQLENVLGSHLVGLQAEPTAAIAGPIDLRARFRHPPFARPSDHTRWTGEVYGSVDYADLAALARTFGAPYTIERAEGAVRSWLRFDRTRITRVVADVALTNVNVTLANDLKPLILSSLQGRLSQRRWGDDNGTGGQELTATRLTMVNASHTTQPLDIEVRTTRAVRGTDARTEVRASRIDLHNLAWLAAHVPLAGALREPFSKHPLTGTLKQVSATWTGATPSAKSLTFKTQFQQLASPAGQAPQHELALPGFDNLSGSIDIANGVGTVQLASKDVLLILPGVFTEPRVKLARLDATARWTSDPIFELRIESLAANNPEIDLSASGTYRLADAPTNGQQRGPGWLDMSGRIARLDASSVHRYVPVGAGHATIEWLRKALLAGKLTDGALRVKGDLAQFPFRSDGQGELRFTGRVADATLDVQPTDRSEGPQESNRTWPLLTGIDADLVFDRASMTVTAPRGAGYGVRLTNVVARVAELGDEATLDVRGAADGPLADMLRYVNASPVARWIGGVTTHGGASGNAKLDLRLTIPLHQTSDSKVVGALQFSNNDVLLADIPPFSRVSGTLNFTQAGVNSSGLNAAVLGGMAKIDASTRADGSIVFGASGTATVTGIRRSVALGRINQVLDRAQGQARYSAALTVKSSPELVIESDLVGIAIDGLAPLRKTAQESMPLRIERTGASDGGERDELKVTAGRGFAVRLERRLERAEFRITRGVIAINEAANLPESGLLVLATLPQIDLQAWSTFLGGGGELEASATKPPAAGGQDVQIDLVAVRTQELVVMGRT